MKKHFLSFPKKEPVLRKKNKGKRGEKMVEEKHGIKEPFFLKKGLIGKSVVVSGILIVMLAVATGSAKDCGGAIPCDCGDTVIEDWTFTEDLSCAKGDGLIIGADGITIDGSGHCINGVEPGTCSGFNPRCGIRGLGYDGLTIKNLEVKNFCFGILLDYDEIKELHNITIENCKVHDNGYVENPNNPDAGEPVIVHGIKLYGVFNSTIRNNEIYNNKGSGTSCEGGGNGIFLRGIDGYGANNNIITHNKIYGNSKSGFFTKMMPKYNEISYNEVWGNGEGGIVLRCKKSAHFTIECNEVHDNHGTGIWIGGPENIIKNNTVSNNRDGGHYVEDPVGGHGWGIKICRYEATGNKLVSNTVCGNDDKDIVVCEIVGEGYDRTTGDNNTCDTIEKYNDEGTTGCRFACEEISAEVQPAPILTPRAPATPTATPAATPGFESVFALIAMLIVVIKRRLRS